MPIRSLDDYKLECKFTFVGEDTKFWEALYD
jgi:hypothetical protein